MGAKTLLIVLMLAGCAAVNPAPEPAARWPAWALIGPPSDGRGSAVWHAAPEHWETEATFPTAVDCQHAQLSARALFEAQRAQANAERDAAQLAVLEPVGRWLHLSRCEPNRATPPRMSQE